MLFQNWFDERFKQYFLWKLKNTSAKKLEKLWDELFQNRSSINRHLKNTCSTDASKSVSFAPVFFSWVLKQKKDFFFLFFLKELFFLYIPFFLRFYSKAENYSPLSGEFFSGLNFFHSQSVAPRLPDPILPTTPPVSAPAQISYLCTGYVNQGYRLLFYQ